MKDEKNPETDEEDTQKLSDEEEKVLEYAENCEDFTKNDVVSLLKVKCINCSKSDKRTCGKEFPETEWKSEKHLLYTSKILKIETIRENLWMKSLQVLFWLS